MGKPSNRPAIERLIERSRVQEQRDKVLAELEAARIQALNQSRCDARVEALRRQNLETAELKGFATELEITVEEQQKQQKLKGEELQQRITDTLERQLQQKEAIDLERQKICLESEEIRKLKEQLTTARVNRERAAQLLERQFRE